MNDWQRVLKQVLDEKEKAEQTIKAEGQPTRTWGKKNRGRGALPLLRPRLQVRSHPVEIDDGSEIHNWRRSPMER